MNVLEFYNNLSEIYPKSLSCPWDNDGIMCCTDLGREVRRVLVALDATKESIEAAKSGGFDTLLVHHPLIFNPISSITSENCVPSRVLSALCGNITVISLHTRLDAGIGGVNDMLAERLMLSDITSFGIEECPTMGRIGTVECTDCDSFAETVKKALGVPAVGVFGNYPVRKVAVVGGSAIEFANEAKRLGADTFVTGECKYHQGLDTAEMGINVIVAEHYYTEFPVCETLRRLTENISGAEVEIFEGLPLRFI